MGVEISLIFNSISTLPLDRMQSIGLDFLHNNLGAIDQTLLNSDKRTSLDLLYQYKQNNMRVDSDLRFDRQGHNFWTLQHQLAKHTLF